MADKVEKTTTVSIAEKTTTADGAEKTSTANGVEKTKTADGAEKTTTAGGAKKTSSANGAEKTTTADGAEKTTTADGAKKTSSANGTEKTTTADGSKKTSSANGAEKTTTTADKTVTADGAEKTADDGQPWSTRMTAWRVDSYGPFEDTAVLDHEFTTPAPVGPKEVLVRVKASSVNPIDVLMAEGYGQVMLSRIRQAKKKSLFKPVEFPLTFGRDFAGQIVAIGANVTAKDLNVGDAVMGVTAPFQPGCHAEFVTVPETQVIKKPEHMSYEEASGLLYTGLTTWSALKTAGGLYALNGAGKNVLVIGGSGGVGNCAIQLLKSWGAKVTTTCNTNAINLVKELGPDNIVDYTTEDTYKQLEQYGKYDLILDAAGIPYDKICTYTPLLKCWSWAAFVTLRSPVLLNTDSYGIFFGMFKNAFDLVVPNVLSGAIFKGSSIRWGFFMPAESGIKELAQLAEEKKIVVPLDNVYKFTDMKDAFKRVKNGHLRGKVIVTFDDTKTDTSR